LKLLDGRVRYINESFLAGTVVLLAAAVRLAHVIFTARSNPLAYNLILDSLDYDRWAKALVWGGELPATKFMAPLYPWFLSVIYRVFGPDLTAVRSVQALLGVFTVAFITVYTRRLFRSSAAGIAAGVLAALYLPSIFYEGVIMPTTLILFLNAFFLFLMVPQDRPPGPARLMVAGFVLGCSVMAKPVALLLLPVGILHLVSTRNYSCHRDHEVTGTNSRLRGRRLLRYSAALLIGLVFAMTPLTIRNSRTTGTFMPVTAGGGISLYIGNNPRANGFYSVPFYRDMPLGATPEVQLQRMRLLAESESKREMSPREISSFWTGKALEYIRTNPRKTASLALRKFMYFFNRYERANVESIQFHRQFGGVISLPLPGYWFAVSFALVGIFLTVKMWDRLLLLYGGILTYLASAVVFYVLARYRMPVVVFMIPFAGAAVTLLLKAVRDRKFIDVVIFALALLLASYATGLKIARDTTFGRATRMVRLGKVYASEGDTARAISIWKEALSVDPGHPDAERCLTDAGVKLPDENK
jgi:hypothetical protein